MPNVSYASVIDICKGTCVKIGIPDVIKTDTGPQFAAREFHVFAAECNYAHATSSPYRSQSNGKTEAAVN